MGGSDDSDGADGLGTKDTGPKTENLRLRTQDSRVKTQGARGDWRATLRKRASRR